jgi:hypothetical protein
MDDALVAAGSTVERVPIARRVLSPCQKNAPVLGARSLRSCLASHLATSSPSALISTTRRLASGRRGKPPPIA